MNSTKKSTQAKEDPIFKIDPETGKFTLLPRKLPSVTSSGQEKLSQKKPTGVIHIRPLKLTSADFEDEPRRAAKVRKTDNNSVRKELFNLPPKRSQTKRLSVRNRQSISRRSIPIKKEQPKKINPCELSPLLDMEEVEEELINKKGCLEGYPFKTPSKPAIKFTKDTKRTPFTRKFDKRQTPKKPTPKKTSSSSSSNDNEFLELEEMCCESYSDKIDTFSQSPISSVCDLLEGTKLSSVKKNNKAVNNLSTNSQIIITSIGNILEQNRIAMEEYKNNHEENLKKITELLETDRKKYDNLIALQDENMNKISNILNALKSSTDVSETQDKENLPMSNRRSRRLFNKSPVQSKDAKIIISPVITKKEDLRKSTLTKNLVAKSQQYQVQSPRLQRALNMYNSMRSEISILTTPKMDRRSLIESPKTTNLQRLLSRKVQSQCHLLQDTPVHK